jgi:hypothetical protein
MPTISDLCKAGHSVAKSAMSSLFLYAAGIIARSTGAAMKPPGGEGPVSIQPLRPARCGSKTIKLPIVHEKSTSSSQTHLQPQSFVPPDF